MAAIDSGVETEAESESLNEDSSNSLPPTPKVAGAQEEEALYGVRLDYMPLLFWIGSNYISWIDFDRWSKSRIWWAITQC